jgi:hypothetical protein
MSDQRRKGDGHFTGPQKIGNAREEVTGSAWKFTIMSARHRAVETG